MSNAAEDHGKRLTDASLRIAAGRQMLGGHLDIFTGLLLLGNERDAEATRMQVHAQLDVILDDVAGMAKLMRAGANLS